MVTGCCVIWNGRQVRFWTRNQKDWTAKFPSVGKAVKALPVKSAILDGEIVALDPSGRASFQRLATVDQ